MTSNTVIMNVSKIATGKVILRVPCVRRAKTIDRTFVLGDNVRFIDIDRANHKTLWIHYVGGAKEVLFYDSDIKHVETMYERIVDALKSTSTFIEHEADEYYNI